ncbi:MAG TPA: tetratricopeptide repeat protein [Candidatus Coprenecus stercoravium]|uniref:Tetratricopeptide repeat protein n=1 Tax=Candidatus Coprenecus stercoravium TaxID=2840735 RepID=A0A9D2GRI7_9BACT|nr:tetratricopeptide repeat protein [Candidatus Coprenecus stercoravium]
MKKILTLITITALSAISLSAQDMESATTVYNEGATALNSGDKITALECFKEALSQAEMIGPEAEELAYNCRTYIPTLINAIGKELASENKLDSAIIVLNEAAAVAEEYGIEDVLVEAQALIPQLYMQQGNLYLNQKDFDKAFISYNEVVKINPNDAVAYLRIGQTARRTGDIETALTALNKAAELGQGNAANKEIAALYLSEANNRLKAKDYAAALDYAQKSQAVLSNPTAMQIAGTAALQTKNYSTAIENFEGFIAASPNARNIDQIRYQLATAYEATGDKTNACVNYKAILNNPQFAEYAKHKVNVELKCQ